MSLEGMAPAGGGTVTSQSHGWGSPPYSSAPGYAGSLDPAPIIRHKMF